MANTSACKTVAKAPRLKTCLVLPPNTPPSVPLHGNIRMDLKEIGVTIKNWVDSAEDRNYWRALVNAALNLWDP